jgi:N-methylhydantoinase A
LEEQARQALATEGFPSAQMRLVRSADLRYFGQAWEVRVEVPPGEVNRALADLAVERFHAAHQQTYGYSYASSPEQRIEWVNLRVTGIGPIQRPRLERSWRTLCGDVGRARTAIRQVYFDEGFVATPIYDRQQLVPGDCVEGPAIVEEFGSTTVVFPTLTARVDDFGNLLLERAA